MIPDIFSSFDSFAYSSFIPLNSIFLSINTFILLIISSSIWVKMSRKINSLNPITTLIISQLRRTTIIKIKGYNSIITTLFILIIIINLLGLIPYLFSSSSHLIFTLTFGLPLWLRIIISSFSKHPKKSTAHFLPDGAPDWLNPFLVLIETTSVIVRPLTLSFRLAANIRAGHIVLSLVGIYARAAWCRYSLTTPILFSIFSIFYILFEVAICLIQAYIFCLLLSLYADDHAN